jgi:serine/threonine-protein kinase
MATMEIRRTFGAGTIIAEKFKIVKLLGEGSLGDDIYLCKQIDLVRDVTLRVLPPSVSSEREMLQRFIQEAKLNASLQHPNILPAYETGEFDGRYYLVNAYSSGEILQDLIKRRGQLDEKETIELVIPLADALGYAWDTQKIIHRNIKPETILINEQGRPLLQDFGMAKSFQPQQGGAELTMMNVTIGNPDYMSPEQVRGERDLDCRSDMYCMGLVMYEMLTGRHPFGDRTQFALMEAHLKEVPKTVREINHTIREGCSGIVERLLAKKRDDRYPSWADLIRDLKLAAQGKPTSFQKPRDTIEDFKKQQKKNAKKLQGPQFIEVEKHDSNTVKILVIIIIVQFLVIIGLFAAFLLK